MATITVDTDRIHQAIRDADKVLNAEWNAITSNDEQCRIWTYRLERLVRMLRAGEAALLMAYDDMIEAETDFDGESGDANSDMVQAAAFRATIGRYESGIRVLTRKERELRGVESDD